jgi:hypothetical protein
MIMILSLCPCGVGFEVVLSLDVFHRCLKTRVHFRNMHDEIVKGERKPVESFPNVTEVLKDCRTRQSSSQHNQFETSSPSFRPRRPSNRVIVKPA